MFKVMRESNMDMNTAGYNIIIHGLCKAGKFDEAGNIFTNLLISGLQPDVQTYNMMIRFSSLGGAEKLYAEMYRRGIVANVITYTTLIHGFRQVGDFNTALDIFQEMVSNGVYSSSITFRDILPQLCSRKELRKAVAMLVQKSSMVSKNVTL
ncbi:unnamed protein product [Arabidopsis thaliana]|uniref:Pentatricopeptide repeat-containing protein n=1 Tax=Arabidopsis thaliana TaxID=3702 RepID=A0A654FDE8_ARATH|nr:unnamed protein product [Arabidopsis thaliana]